MKILIFPMSNVFQFFVMFYLPNDYEKNFVKIGKHPTLMKMTAQIREKIGNLPTDKHIEDHFEAAHN